MRDAARIRVLLADRSVSRNVSMSPYSQSEIGVEGFILLMEARRGLGRDHVFGLDHPTEGLIGVGGAHVSAPDEIEIGYWLGRPYWGQGYATEVGRALAAYAKGLGQGEVVTGHFADNPASGRVLQRAGFDYTGAVTPRFSVARRENVPLRIMRLAEAA
jgi:RimJ/RimL family protein N-acetyltransferase